MEQSLRPDEQKSAPERGGEPRVQARASPFEDRINRLYERIESVLTLVVAIFLIAAVINQIRDPLFVTHDFTEAVIRGIDAIFLAIILLELLHTTLARGSVSEQLQEFLVIGMTAAIRHGLDVAASSRSESPRDVVINLTINSAGALVLVLALWLVRHQLRADRTTPRAEETANTLG